MYLQELKELLEHNGIPAVVIGENTARMIPPLLLFQPGLWIYLDDQFDDALCLINDTNHQVSTGIDTHEFYNSQPAEEEQSSLLNKALMDLAVYAIVLCIGIFFLLMVIESLGS